MRGRSVTVFLVGVVLLAACGSGKDKAATSTSTTSPSTTVAGAPTTTASSPTGGTTATTKGATKPTVAPSPSDAARLEKLVLVAGDFPTGWKDTPTPPPDPNDDANAQLNECLGASGSAAETAHKYGDTFTNGDSTQASADSSTVKDDATYRADLVALQGPKLSPCIKEAFGKELAKNAGDVGASTTVDVADLSVAKHGDATVGRRITVTVKGPTQTAKFYIDFVFMGHHRAEVTASFLNVGSPFDSALEKSALDKLGGRVAAT